MTLIAPPDLRPLGFALAEQAAVPIEFPGIGLWVPERLRLIVVESGASLRRAGGRPVPSWGVGYAFPRSSTIVIRADAIDPAGALRHELAHLALHARIQGRVPLWFDEGYAVVAAREFGRWLGLELNLAVATRGVGDLAALDRALRGAAPEAQTAYALAGSAVGHLIQLQPTGSLDRFVARLADGVGFEPALREVTGYDLAEFERSWQRELKRRYGLLVWVAAGGWLALTALAVALGVWYRRRREGPRRRALDLGWPLPGPGDGSQLDQRQSDS